MLRKGVEKKFKWMPLPGTQKAEALYNPYCGMYRIYRFTADCDQLQPDGIPIEKVLPDINQQLCLVEINLLPYNEESLSDEALNLIKRIFEHFSKYKKQMIVRFVYDLEGKGVLNEPKDIAVILGHMNQLSPLLISYTASIYILQGLFIGSWGEMHSSRYLSERNMTRLAKQLYECSGEKTYIALRCPSFWRMIFQTYQPLDSDTAFTGIQKARFSLYNDGIMASDADFGTYGSISALESKTYGDKWVRDDELEFQYKLNRYVPNGGEVINECPYNDVLPALETLKKMRVSYLHSEYDEKVLDKWKRSLYESDGVLWKKKSAYEFIEAHIGYRFSIEEVNVSLSADKSSSLKVTIKIRNLGFAPCYHRFDVKIIVRTASYTKVYEYPVDTDTSRWMPSEKAEFTSILSTEEWDQNTYILGLSVYDPRSEQVIKLDNTFSVPDHTGVYRLGNLSLGKGNRL